jgi:hypothetical protein
VYGGQGFHGSIGPSDFDPVRTIGITKSEVQAEIALRSIAAAAPYFVHLP